MDVHDQVLHPRCYYYWSASLIAVLALVCSVVLLVVQSLVGVAPIHSEPVVVVSPQVPPPGQAAPGPAPAVTVPADLVRHTARTDRVVALTFDDGPHPEYTPQILALLAQYHIVATFCMIGSEATRHPELVHQVVAAGMHLCDHTINHDQHLIDRPEPQIEAEITGGRTSLLTAAGTDVAVDYFRAPAGRWSEPVQSIAARNGMRPLSWSVDPRDWSRPGTAQIVATVQQQVQPGAVILLHDGGGRRDQTVAALAELLPWFIGQSYQFDVPG